MGTYKFFQDFNTFGFKEEYFTNLIKFIHGKSKLDRNIFSSIGKGKWLISSISINKEIRINSSFSLNSLTKNLIEKVFNNNRIGYLFNGNIMFWDSTSGEIKKELIKVLKDQTMIIKFDKEDREISSIEFSISGIANKKKIIKMLDSVFDSISFDISFRLSLNEKDFKIDIYFENKELTIRCNNMDKIRNLLESFFSCKNLRNNYFCLYYINIKEIEGKDWKTAIRHGELIKEFGSFKNPKIKKYKF